MSDDQHAAIATIAALATLTGTQSQLRSHLRIGLNAGLATLTGTQSQLRSHLRIGLNAGLSEAQLRGLVRVLRAEVGQQQGNAAAEILDDVLKNRQESPT